MKKNEDAFEDAKILKLQFECQHLLHDFFQQGSELDIHNISEMSYILGSSISSVIYDVVDFEDSSEEEIKKMFSHQGQYIIQGFLDKLYLLLQNQEQILLVSLEDE